ncbi:HECT type ubiquitin ligase, putative [Eimeria brunetti]|uniref:HECT type ubiquitin ligase, putative n=1 Tax=Eimeria brunetti TaxID=51314 RepID=U6LLY4_9EIME|nr:HECT type ubiquitin ligase, putative [Eimeria brunetti]
MEAQQFQRLNSQGEGEEGSQVQGPLSAFSDADQGPVDIERGPQDPERSLTHTATTDRQSILTPHPHNFSAAPASADGPTQLQSRTSPTSGAPIDAPPHNPVEAEPALAAQGRDPQGAPQESPRASWGASTLPSCLYSSAELQKYATYDAELFDALLRSRCCCRWGPIAAFAAAHAAQQSALTPKGVERYLNRRTHIYRQAHDLLLGLGGLVDFETAAAAAAAAAAAGRPHGAAEAATSAPGGVQEDDEQPHHHSSSSSNSNSNNHSGSSKKELQRRALKWTTKKLRWMCDDALAVDPVLLEGPIALKCCFLREAFAAVVRQGLRDKRFFWEAPRAGLHPPPSLLGTSCSSRSSSSSNSEARRRKRRAEVLEEVFRAEGGSQELLQHLLQRVGELPDLDLPFGAPFSNKGILGAPRQTGETNKSSVESSSEGPDAINPMQQQRSSSALDGVSGLWERPGPQAQTTANENPQPAAPTTSTTAATSPTSRASYTGGSLESHAAATAVAAAPAGSNTVLHENSVRMKGDNANQERPGICREQPEGFRCSRSVLRLLLHVAQQHLLQHRICLRSPAARKAVYAAASAAAAAAGAADSGRDQGDSTTEDPVTTPAFRCRSSSSSSSSSRSSRSLPTTPPVSKEEVQEHGCVQQAAPAAHGAVVAPSAVAAADGASTTPGSTAVVAMPAVRDSLRENITDNGETFARKQPVKAATQGPPPPSSPSAAAAAVAAAAALGGGKRATVLAQETQKLSTDRRPASSISGKYREQELRLLGAAGSAAEGARTAIRGHLPWGPHDMRPISEGTGKSACMLLQRIALRLVFAVALCSSRYTAPVRELQRFVAAVAVALKPCLAAIKEVGERVRSPQQKQGQQEKQKQQEQQEQQPCCKGVPNLEGTLLDCVAVPLCYGIAVISACPWLGKLQQNAAAELYSLLLAADSAVYAHPVLQQLVEALSSGSTNNQFYELQHHSQQQQQQLQHQMQVLDLQEHNICQPGFVSHPPLHPLLRVVETPHPYSRQHVAWTEEAAAAWASSTGVRLLQKQQQQQHRPQHFFYAYHVCLPAASHIILLFDPKSETEGPHDALWIYRGLWSCAPSDVPQTCLLAGPLGGSRTEEPGGPFMGAAPPSGASFPQHPLVVGSSSITLLFSVAEKVPQSLSSSCRPKGSMWGFKVYCLGQQWALPPAAAAAAEAAAAATAAQKHNCSKRQGIAALQKADPLTRPVHGGEGSSTNTSRNNSTDDNSVMDIPGGSLCVSLPTQQHQQDGLHLLVEFMLACGAAVAAATAALLRGPPAAAHEQQLGGALSSQLFAGGYCKERIPCVRRLLSRCKETPGAPPLVQPWKADGKRHGQQQQKTRAPPRTTNTESLEEAHPNCKLTQHGQPLGQQQLPLQQQQHGTQQPADCCSAHTSGGPSVAPVAFGLTHPGRSSNRPQVHQEEAVKGPSQTHEAPWGPCRKASDSAEQQTPAAAAAYPAAAASVAAAAPGEGEARCKQYLLEHALPLEAPWQAELQHLRSHPESICYVMWTGSPLGRPLALVLEATAAIFSRRGPPLALGKNSRSLAGGALVSETVGGVSLQLAVKAYCCCLLHHLHMHKLLLSLLSALLKQAPELVEAAAAVAAHSSSNSSSRSRLDAIVKGQASWLADQQQFAALVFVWSGGRTLRQWAVGERQRAVLAAEAKRRDLAAAAAAVDAETSAATSQQRQQMQQQQLQLQQQLQHQQTLSCYSFWAAVLLSKAALLMRLKPYSSKHRKREESDLPYSLVAPGLQPLRTAAAATTATAHAFRGGLHLPSRMQHAGLFSSSRGSCASDIPLVLSHSLTHLSSNCSSDSLALHGSEVDHLHAAAAGATGQPSFASTPVSELHSSATAPAAAAPRPAPTEPAAAEAARHDSDAEEAEEEYSQETLASVLAFLTALNARGAHVPVGSPKAFSSSRYAAAAAAVAAAAPPTSMPHGPQRRCKRAIAALQRMQRCRAARHLQQQRQQQQQEKEAAARSISHGIAAVFFAPPPALPPTAARSLAAALQAVQASAAASAASVACSANVQPAAHQQQQLASLTAAAAASAAAAVRSACVAAANAAQAAAGPMAVADSPGSDTAACAPGAPGTGQSEFKGLESQLVGGPLQQLLLVQCIGKAAGAAAAEMVKEVAAASGAAAAAAASAAGAALSFQSSFKAPQSSAATPVAAEATAAAAAYVGAEGDGSTDTAFAAAINSAAAAAAAAKEAEDEAAAAAASPSGPLDDLSCLADVLRQRRLRAEGMLQGLDLLQHALLSLQGPLPLRLLLQVLRSMGNEQPLGVPLPPWGPQAEGNLQLDPAQCLRWRGCSSISTGNAPCLPHYPLFRPYEFPRGGNDPNETEDQRVQEDLFASVRGCGVQLERQLQLFHYRAVAVAMLLAEAHAQQQQHQPQVLLHEQHEMCVLHSHQRQPMAQETNPGCDATVPPASTAAAGAAAAATHAPEQCLPQHCSTVCNTALSVLGFVPLAEGERPHLQQTGVLDAVFAGALPILQQQQQHQQPVLSPPPYNRLLLLFIVCLRAAASRQKPRIVALQCCTDLLLIAALQTAAATFLPHPQLSQQQQQQQQHALQQPAAVNEIAFFLSWDSTANLFAGLLLLLLSKTFTSDAAALQQQHRLAAAATATAEPADTEATDAVAIAVATPVASSAATYDHWSPSTSLHSWQPELRGYPELHQLCTSLCCGSSNSSLDTFSLDPTPFYLHSLLSSDALVAAVSLLLACGSPRLKRQAVMLLKLLLPLSSDQHAAAFLLPALRALVGGPSHSQGALRDVLLNAAAAASNRRGCYFFKPTAAMQQQQFQQGQLHRQLHLLLLQHKQTGASVASLSGPYSPLSTSSVVAAPVAATAAAGAEATADYGGRAAADGAAAFHSSAPASSGPSRGLSPRSNGEGDSSSSSSWAAQVAESLLAAIGCGVAVCRPETIGTAALQQLSAEAAAAPDNSTAQDSSSNRPTPLRILASPMAFALGECSSGLSQLSRYWEEHMLHQLAHGGDVLYSLSSSSSSSSSSSPACIPARLLAYTSTASQQAALSLDLRGLLRQLLLCRQWGPPIRQRLRLAMAYSSKLLEEGAHGLLQTATDHAVQQLRVLQQQKQHPAQKDSLQQNVHPIHLPYTPIQQQHPEAFQAALDITEPVERRSLDYHRQKQQQLQQQQQHQPPLHHHRHGHHHHQHHYHSQPSPVPMDPYRWLVDECSAVGKATAAATAAAATEAAGAFPNDGNRTWSKAVCEALGALAVLGGSPEFLRVGSSLQSDSSNSSELLQQQLLVQQQSSRLVMLSKYEGLALLQVDEGDRPTLQLSRVTAATAADLCETDGHAIADLLLRGAEQQRQVQEQHENEQNRHVGDMNGPDHRATSSAAAATAAAAAADAIAAEGSRAVLGQSTETEALLKEIVRLTLAAEQGLLEEPSESCAAAGNCATSGAGGEAAGVTATAAYEAAADRATWLPAGRVASLLLLQLRTMALSAVSELLQSRQVAASLLLQQQLLQSLLIVCLRPISVPYLEGLEELRGLSLRLRQLLRDRLHGCLAIENRLLLRETAADILQHCPFSGLPLLLPTAWERRTAQGFACPPEDWTVLLQAQGEQQEQKQTEAGFEGTQFSATNPFATEEAEASVPDKQQEHQHQHQQQHHQQQQGEEGLLLLAETPVTCTTGGQSLSDTLFYTAATKPTVDTATAATTAAKQAAADADDEAEAAAKRAHAVAAQCRQLQSIAQANRAIPTSLPAYYFEVYIEAEAEHRQNQQLPQNRDRDRCSKCGALNGDTVHSETTGATDCSLACGSRQHGHTIAPDACCICSSTRKDDDSEVAPTTNSGSSCCPLVAVGLHVDGCVLKAGGSSMSSGYLYCSTGLLVHGASAATAAAGRADAYGRGDTVGVLLNARQRCISFTKNGYLLKVLPWGGSSCSGCSKSPNSSGSNPTCSGSKPNSSRREACVAFREVRGCFRPAVWAASSKGMGDPLRLKANFGEAPFRYPFAASLDIVEMQQLLADMGLPLTSMQLPGTPQPSNGANNSSNSHTSREEESVAPAAAAAAADGDHSTTLIQAPREGVARVSPAGSSGVAVGPVVGRTCQGALSALSEEALQRRAAAETLRDMMGSGLFPLGLCVSALRLQGDDLQAAAEWLLTSGMAELEAMQMRFLEEADASEEPQQQQHLQHDVTQQGTDLSERTEGNGNTDNNNESNNAGNNSPTNGNSSAGMSTGIREASSSTGDLTGSSLYSLMQHASEQVAPEFQRDEAHSSSNSISSSSSSSLSDEVAAAVLRSTKWYDDILSAAVRHPPGGVSRAPAVACGRDWRGQLQALDGPGELQMLPPKELRLGLFVRIHPSAASLVQGVIVFPEAAADPAETAADTAVAPALAAAGAATTAIRAPWEANRPLQQHTCSSNNIDASAARRAVQELLLSAPQSAAEGNSNSSNKGVVTTRVVEGLVASATGNVLLLEELAGRCGFIWQIDGLEELHLAAEDKAPRTSSNRLGYPTVVLEIEDEETGVRRLIRLPQTVLCRARPSWGPLHGLEALLENLNEPTLQPGKAYSAAGGGPPIGALLTLLERLEGAVAGLQVRQALRRMLEAFEGSPRSPFGCRQEGPAGDMKEIGGLSPFLKLLQLSYSELGPPCFAGGGLHRTATLISSCFAVWQQSKKIAAAAPHLPQLQPPSFMSFFLSSSLGAHTLLPVPTHCGTGDLLAARGGLGGPPSAPFAISPLLQQLPCSNLHQLLRLLQLLARALVLAGPHGGLVEQLGPLVLQQLRAGFSHRLSVHCVESSHPFGQHQDSLTTVSFLPCRRLLLLLDPRTDLGGSEQGCTLSLSADEDQETVCVAIKHTVVLCPIIEFLLQQTSSMADRPAAVSLLRQLFNILQPLSYTPAATLRTPEEQKLLRLQLQHQLQQQQQVGRVELPETFACCCAGGFGVSFDRSSTISRRLLQLRAEAAAAFGCLYSRLEAVTNGGFAGSTKLLSGMGVLAAAAQAEATGEETAARARLSPEVRTASDTHREISRDRLRATTDVLLLCHEHLIDPLVRRLCGLASAPDGDTSDGSYMQKQQPQQQQQRQHSEPSHVHVCQSPPAQSVEYNEQQPQQQQQQQRQNQQQSQEHQQLQQNQQQQRVQQRHGTPELLSALSISCRYRRQKPFFLLPFAVDGCPAVIAQRPWPQQQQQQHPLQQQQQEVQQQHRAYPTQEPIREEAALASMPETLLQQEGQQQALVAQQQQQQHQQQIQQHQEQGAVSFLTHAGSGVFWGHTTPVQEQQQAQELQQQQEAPEPQQKEQQQQQEQSQPRLPVGSAQVSLQYLTEFLRLKLRLLKASVGPHDVTCLLRGILFSLGGVCLQLPPERQLWLPLLQLCGLSDAAHAAAATAAEQTRPNATDVAKAALAAVADVPKETMRQQKQQQSPQDGRHQGAAAATSAGAVSKQQQQQQQQHHHHRHPEDPNNQALLRLISHLSPTQQQFYFSAFTCSPLTSESTALVPATPSPAPVVAAAVAEAAPSVSAALREALQKETLRVWFAADRAASGAEVFRDYAEWPPGAAVFLAAFPPPPFSRCLLTVNFLKILALQRDAALQHHQKAAAETTAAAAAAAAGTGSSPLLQLRGERMSDYADETVTEATANATHAAAAATQAPASTQSAAATETAAEGHRRRIQTPRPALAPLYRLLASVPLVPSQEGAAAAEAAAGVAVSFCPAAAAATPTTAATASSNTDDFDQGRGKLQGNGESSASIDTKGSDPSSSSEAAADCLRPHFAGVQELLLRCVAETAVKQHHWPVFPGVVPVGEPRVRSNCCCCSSVSSNKSRILQEAGAEAYRALAACRDDFPEPVVSVALDARPPCTFSFWLYDDEDEPLMPPPQQQPQHQKQPQQQQMAIVSPLDTPQNPRSSTFNRRAPGLSATVAAVATQPVPPLPGAASSSNSSSRSNTGASSISNSSTRTASLGGAPETAVLRWRPMRQRSELTVSEAPSPAIALSRTPRPQQQQQQQQQVLHQPSWSSSVDLNSRQSAGGPSRSEIRYGTSPAMHPGDVPPFSSPWRQDQTATTPAATATTSAQGLSAPPALHQNTPPQARIMAGGDDPMTLQRDWDGSPQQLLRRDWPSIQQQQQQQQEGSGEDPRLTNSREVWHRFAADSAALVEMDTQQQQRLNLQRQQQQPRQQQGHQQRLDILSHQQDLQIQVQQQIETRQRQERLGPQDLQQLEVRQQQQDYVELAQRQQLSGQQQQQLGQQPPPLVLLEQQQQQQQQQPQQSPTELQLQEQQLGEHASAFYSGDLNGGGPGGPSARRIPQWAAPGEGVPPSRGPTAGYRPPIIRRGGGLTRIALLQGGLFPQPPYRQLLQRRGDVAASPPPFGPSSSSNDSPQQQQQQPYPQHQNQHQQQQQQQQQQHQQKEQDDACGTSGSGDRQVAGRLRRMAMAEAAADAHADACTCNSTISSSSSNNNGGNSSRSSSRTRKGCCRCSKGGGRRLWRLVWMRGCVSETVSVWLSPENRVYVQLRVPLQTTTYMDYQAVAASLSSSLPLQPRRWTHVGVTVGVSLGKGLPLGVRLYLDGREVAAAPIGSRCCLCQGPLPFWVAPLPLPLRLEEILKPPPHPPFTQQQQQQQQQPYPRCRAHSMKGFMADLRVYSSCLTSKELSEIVHATDQAYGVERIAQLLHCLNKRHRCSSSSSISSEDSSSSDRSLPTKERIVSQFVVATKAAQQQHHQQQHQQQHQQHQQQQPRRRQENELLLLRLSQDQDLVQLWRLQKHWNYWEDTRRSLPADPRTILWRYSGVQTPPQQQQQQQQQGQRRQQQQIRGKWELVLQHVDLLLSEEVLGAVLGVLEEGGEAVQHGDAAAAAGAAAAPPTQGGSGGSVEGRVDIDSVRHFGSLLQRQDFGSQQPQQQQQLSALRRRLEANASLWGVAEVSLQLCRAFTQLLVSVGPCLELFSPRPSSFSLTLQAFRHLLPASLKHWLVNLCLSLSEDPRADGRLRIAINRARALRAGERAAAASPAGAASAAGAPVGMHAAAAAAAAASAASTGTPVAAGSSSNSSSSSRGLKDVTMQLAEQLESVSPWLLRRSNRVWFVAYEGEGGIDAGGLYRDLFSHVAAELQTPGSSNALLLPSANSRGFGQDQDMWQVNPQAPSAARLAAYRVLGRLMGVVLRGRLSLGLNLSPMVWRPLVGLSPEPKDLEATDALAVQILKKVLALDSDGFDARSFAEAFSLSWCTTSASGAVVSLKEGGGDTAVHWDDRQLYVLHALAFRLAEGQRQVAAVRQGLGDLVPLQIVDLLEPYQLQQLVCGSPSIDLQLLKSHTKYTGYTESDKQIKWFWEALESFSQAERQRFLRFVWGRSRLPLAHATWEQDMEVTLKVPAASLASSRRPAAVAGTATPAPAAAGPAAGADAAEATETAEDTSPRTITTPASGDAVVAQFNSSEAAGSNAVQRLADEMLPQSHTCFFQVDLPPYSSYEVLRRKLLYAVTEGIAIDADNTADAANWEFEGD